MWTYSTNIMGPMKWWYEKNNIPFKKIKKYSKTLKKEIEYIVYETNYSGGRIDCYCDNINDPFYSKYNQELPLPIIEDISYQFFSDWLEKLETKEWIQDNKILFEMFEKETGIKLEIFKKRI